MLHIEPPAEIESPLFEGPLQLDDGSEREAEKGETKRSSSRALRIRTPRVSLGRIEWWNLTTLLGARNEDIPVEIQLASQASVFYLVRCACSFRAHPKTTIEWARLSVALGREAGHEHPIAWDMFPRDVLKESEEEVATAVSPKLKFFGCEATGGSRVTTIHSTRLEPVIIGTGVQESVVSWDFESGESSGVRGAKFLYLVVKRPKTTPAVQFELEVVARVRSEKVWFLASTKTIGRRLVERGCTT